MRLAVLYYPLMSSQTRTRREEPPGAVRRTQSVAVPQLIRSHPRFFPSAVPPRTGHDTARIKYALCSRSRRKEGRQGRLSLTIQVKSTVPAGAKPRVALSPSSPPAPYYTHTLARPPPPPPARLTSVRCRWIWGGNADSPRVPVPFPATAPARRRRAGTCLSRNGTSERFPLALGRRTDSYTTPRRPYPGRGPAAGRRPRSRSCDGPGAADGARRVSNCRCR